MADYTQEDAYMEETMVDTGTQKYLTFALGDEEYGVNIQYVTEIIGIQKVTEMPDTAEYIKGVINLRGKVIPVIDMRLRFHKQERDYDERTCIVVVNVDDTAVGIIVDTVSEVLDIPQEDIDAPPQVAAGAGTRRDYIEGLGRVNEQVKILLDIERVLYDEQLQELAENA